MNDKPVKKNDTLRTWLIVSIIINAYLIAICIRDEREERTVKQIKMSPKDTLWDKDSAYVVRSKIDSVYYDPLKGGYQPDKY